MAMRRCDLAFGTTQFTVINAVVLRGFSFPHPEQLASVGLIDPGASAQNNNFGAGNIPSAQDYEELRAAGAVKAIGAGINEWEIAEKLARGPTRAYAAHKALLKSWTPRAAG